MGSEREAVSQPLLALRVAQSECLLRLRAWISQSGSARDLHGPESSYMSSCPSQGFTGDTRSHRRRPVRTPGLAEGAARVAPKITQTCGVPDGSHIEFHGQGWCQGVCLGQQNGLASPVYRSCWNHHGQRLGRTNPPNGAPTGLFNL